MARAKGCKFRWVSPLGRRGRWRRSAVGAVIAAVSERFSQQSGTVRVSLDAEGSAALWPGMVAEGWKLERGDGGHRGASQP